MNQHTHVSKLVNDARSYQGYTNLEPVSEAMVVGGNLGKVKFKLNEELESESGSAEHGHQFINGNLRPGTEAQRSVVMYPGTRPYAS